MGIFHIVRVLLAVAGGLLLVGLVVTAAYLLFPVVIVLALVFVIGAFLVAVVQTFWQYCCVRWRGGRDAS